MSHNFRWDVVAAAAERCLRDVAGVPLADAATSANRP
jgi:hypothetical protein